MAGNDRFPTAARRVLVVDDSEVVRMKLRQLVDHDPTLELVGEAPDGESGVRLASELQPDVVVMDLRMPGISGIKATWELGELTPDSRVLVLTVSDDPEDVADAIMAGATGYVVKGAGDDEIRDTIHRVADGQSVLSHQVAGALFERTRTHAGEAGAATAVAAPPAEAPPAEPAESAERVERVVQLPPPPPSGRVSAPVAAAVAIAALLGGVAAGALLF